MQHIWHTWSVWDKHISETTGQPCQPHHFVHVKCHMATSWPLLSSSLASAKNGCVSPRVPCDTSATRKAAHAMATTNANGAVAGTSERCETARRRSDTFAERERERETWRPPGTCRPFVRTADILMFGSFQIGNLRCSLDQHGMCLESLLGDYACTGVGVSWLGRGVSATLN